jgi:hypothetical protein
MLSNFSPIIRIIEHNKFFLSKDKKDISMLGLL